MDVKLRPVCNQDVPALVELTLQAFVPIFDSFPRILGDSIYQKIWPDWKASQTQGVKTLCEDSGRYTVLVADVDGEPVGFVAYDVDDVRKTGTIQLIAVHPDHQNRGVGTELCRAATQDMKERGMELASVETAGDSSHLPARRAYERAGYVGLPLVRYFKSLSG
ncbi:MAG: GNAT family N-acetyltransferase [Candidatus Bipolaricaulota bacterium]